MEDKFVVKKNNEKSDKFIIMSLRIDKDLQKEFDILAKKSERSRNELMCKALKYSLAHLEFISEEDDGYL